MKGGQNRHIHCKLFMSTYIDTMHPERHAPYDDIPRDVRDFLNYLGAILNRSPRTVNAYYIDLRLFFKFLLRERGTVAADCEFEDIDIRGIDTAAIASVTQAEIYEYLYFLKNERGNEPAARARKLTSIKSFYRFMTVKSNRLTDDPAKDISVPSLKKALPKYLSLEESIELLKNIQSDFYERDYCILTLFLNCGMRLSELVAIDLKDFQEDTIRIVGKGNKERLVYLNTACLDALNHYRAARSALGNLQEPQALLVSQKTGKRLSARRVQQIVGRCLQAAGLSGKGYSPHKLRHTAATLMYRHGNVDMLELKEILGHAHVSTTEIYTHINTEKLRKAAKSTPLARISYMEPEKPAAQSEEAAKDQRQNDGKPAHQHGDEADR